MEGPLKTLHCVIPDPPDVYGMLAVPELQEVKSWVGTILIAGAPAKDTVMVSALAQAVRLFMIV